MMSRQFFLRVSFALVGLLAWFAPAACAQYPGYVTNSDATGMPNYGAYISSQIDTVALGNGNLTLHIPTLSRKGRGLDYSAYIDYQTKYWTMTTFTVANPYGQPTTYFLWEPDSFNAAWNLRWNVGGGLDWTEQQYTCQPTNEGETPTVVVRSNWVYISADGTKHPIPLRENVGINFPGFCTDAGPGDQPQNLQAYTDDGLIYVDISQDQLNNHSGIKITRPDGSQVDRSTPASALVEDTNGNYFNGSNLTDTLGRQISVPTGTPCNGSAQNGTLTSTIGYLDSNGNTQTITVTCIALSLNTAFPTTSYDQYHLVDQYTGSLWVVSKITLPNGLSYNFSYVDPSTGQTNPFGELMQVTLPTGGYIKYKWASYATADQGPVDPQGVLGRIYIDSRVVTERDVSLDGVNEQVWTYYGGKVTDPLGNYEIHYTGGSITCGQNQSTNADQPTPDLGVMYYNSAGKLLKSVANVFACDWGPVFASQMGMDYNPNSQFTPGFRNFRMTSSTTTLADTNQVSQAQTDYTDCFTYPLFGISQTDCRPNPTATREYDFGSGSPGPLLRSSAITYLHNQSSGTAYLNAHIWDRVYEKIVYNGSGTQIAATQYAYDGTAITGTSSVPNHDYTTYPGSNTVRGNVTSVSRWLSTTNSWLTTTNYYNDVGNLVQTTDPNGNSYSLNYTDNFTDGTNRNSQGFLTSVTSPTTNGVSHIEGKQYYWNTGLTAAVCGQNASSPANCSNSTSTEPDFAKYTYDGLGRPLTVTHGDGSVADFTFTEPASPSSSNPITVSLSSQIDSTHNLVNTAVIDTLGRVNQTQLNSDPGGADYVNTTYDVLGRKSTVTNPFRTTSDPTYGVTTSLYDALGRTTTVIPPDGTSSSNNVTTAYSGNSVTVTDQAGKQRRSFTDGLGRLIEVDEPGAPAGATASNGYALITGAEQTGGGAPGTGTVTITGGEQWTQEEQYPTCTLYDCGGDCLEWSNGSRDGSPTQVTVYDSGSLFLTVNGRREGVGYGSSSTSASIAANLVSVINGDSSASVTATASGAVVTLTAKSHGVATDYSWSNGVQSYDSTDFSSASFGFSAASGALANGVNDYPDTGTITLTIGGVQNSATYGSGSTPATIATALASAVNGNSSSLVTASASGGTLNFTEKTQGSTPPISVSVSGNYPTVFNPISFAAVVSDEFLNAYNTAPPASLLTPMVTLYSYDALNNLTCVEQHGNVSGTGCSSASSNDASSAWRVRRFTYDSLKRLVSVHNPESGTTSYTYDSNGNVLTRTSPLANQTGSSTVTITYAYDALNRLTSRTYSDSTPTVKISYDGTAPSACSPTLTPANPIGRRTAMCDAAGFEAWSYDVRGRAVTDQRNTNSITRNTTYAYNFAGANTSVTYPSGRTINYTYNAAGQALSATDATTGVTYAANAVYNAAGALASLQNGSSIVTNMFYNTRLQPCRIAVNSSGTAPASCSDTNLGNILDYSYNFNLGVEDNGNPASVANNINTARSESFTYDELNRVKTAQSQATSGTYSWGLLFGYDPWANLLSAGVTQGSAYSLSVSATGNNQLSGLSYDAAGNTLNDGTNSYTFNAENQIVTAAGVTYTYDGDGNRVKKSNGKLYWNGDASDPLDETDASGNLTDEYIFFGGVRIARRDASNNVLYYFADHLGTSRVTTNSSGVVQDDSDFYPFGGERAYTSTSGNTHKFTGKERDTETGLDNFGARYMSSNLGRFMSADDAKFASASDPQTLNLYSYVSNHPMTMIDPTGHEQYCEACHMQPMQHAGGGDEFGGGEGGGTTYDGGSTDDPTYIVQTTDENGVTGPAEHIKAGSAQAAKSIALANIADVANSKVGSLDYLVDKTKGAYKAGTDKCNELVADTIEESGRPRPQVSYSGWRGWLGELLGRTRDPDANEWANPNINIPGWSSPKPLSEATAGDVIAQQHGQGGHSGIVVGPRQTVSVNTAANPHGIVTRNDWGYRPGGGEGPGDPPPVVRHYNGGN